MDFVRLQSDKILRFLLYMDSVVYFIYSVLFLPESDLNTPNQYFAIIKDTATLVESVFTERFWNIYRFDIFLGIFPCIF